MDCVAEGTTGEKPMQCLDRKEAKEIDEDDLDEYLDDPYIGPKSPKNKYNKFSDSQQYKWKTRGPTPARLIQLAFHDCLRYKDGSGGCDGCLNWSGMGYASPRFKPTMHDMDETDNMFPPRWGLFIYGSDKYGE